MLEWLQGEKMEPTFFWVFEDGVWSFVRKIRYNRSDDSYTVKFANRALKTFPAVDIERWQREKGDKNESVPDWTNG